MNNKILKIIPFFLLINYLHLTPTTLKFFLETKGFVYDLREGTLILSLWLLGLVVLWLCITTYFILLIIKAVKNKKLVFNEKSLLIYLTLNYLFLLPFFFLNIDEIIFSSIHRTLAMVGMVGLIKIWLSVIIFVSTTIVLIVNFISKKVKY